MDVNIRNPELQARYMLRAVEPASGEALLNPFLESELLDWKKTPPLIRRDSTGITMEIKGERLKTPEDLLAFIRIGEALLAQNKYHFPSRMGFGRKPKKELPGKFSRQSFSRRRREEFYYGSRTASMTWMTPLRVTISVMMTLTVSFK